MRRRLTVPSREEILNGPVVKTMFRLAWPIMISAFLNMLYNMADTFWVGHLPASENTAAVAGLQLSGPVIWLLMSFAAGFASAGLALVSQYVGAHDEVNAEKAAGQSMSLGIIYGIGVAIVGFLLTPVVLPLLTGATDVSSAAVRYTRLIFLGMPAVFVTALYAQLMNAYGDTVMPMIINAFTVLLNVVLDPFLIFGWGPFPRMTVEGAALATSLCQVIAAAISLWLLMSGRRRLHVVWRDLRPEFPWVRRLLRIGIPAAIGGSGTSLGFVVLTAIVGRVPNATIALSAYGIGDRLIMTTGIITDSAGIGIATMVGQALGAGRDKRANAVVKHGTIAVVVILAAASIFLRVIAPTVFRWFIPNQPAVIAEGVLFLSIFLWANPFFGLMMGVQSAFMGAGHNGPNMVLDLVRLWGLRVPLAWLLGIVMHMGSRGVWTSMTISNVVAGTLSLILILTVDWHRSVIETGPAPDPALVAEGVATFSADADSTSSL